MSMNRLAIVAAACLLASVRPAAADDAAVPTAVLVDRKLAYVHLLTALPPEEIYQRIPSHILPGMGSVPSSGNLGADVAGAAIAAIIINMQADEIAQTNADQELNPLNGPLGRDGTQAVMREGFDAGFAAAGFDQRALVFATAQAIGPELFLRLPAAKEADRYVIVRDGRGGKGVFAMPLALDYTHRQLRLALDVEVRGGRLDRQSRLHRQDVVWYSDPLPVAEGVDALEWLAKDEQAAYKAMLSQAVVDAVQLALAERDLPRVGRDAEVGAIGELGLTEFPGELVAHEDGRALIATRDSLISVPATQIVTGDALATARVDEAARREAFVAALEEAQEKEDAELTEHEMPEMAPSAAGASSGE